MKKIRRMLGTFARKHLTGLYKIYEKFFWGIVEKRKKQGLHELGYIYVEKISKSLEKFEIQYFITYGTLLGIIREGKFIGHDDDIDFGVIFDEKFTWDKLEAALKEAGMQKKHQFRLEGEITEQTYIADKLSVDFFLFCEYSSTEHVSYAYFRRKNKLYENDTFEVSRNRVPTIGSIIKTKTEKGIFAIPNNSEQFLEAVYGADWRTPNPNWVEDMDIVEGKVGYLERG